MRRSAEDHLHALEIPLSLFSEEAKTARESIGGRDLRTTHLPSTRAEECGVC